MNVAYVSIRAFARKATSDSRVRSRASRSFNPRLREEGDLCEAAKTIAELVSIRAFARKATTVRDAGRQTEIVSIRAFARKATTTGQGDRTRRDRFNPRLREEGDPQAQDVVIPALEVSIRAFARKATCLTKPMPSRCSHVSIRAFARKATKGAGDRSRPQRRFNPRLREEGDSCRRTTGFRHQAVSIRAFARKATHP